MHNTTTALITQGAQQVTEGAAATQALMSQDGASVPTTQAHTQEQW